jgi:hypothetical protein
MHIYVIEKPLACKIKFVKCVRSTQQGKHVESPRYRFKKTAQQLRRSRLRWYRLTSGKPYLWPPINMHQYYELKED